MIKKYIEFIVERSSGEIFNPTRGEYEVFSLEGHEELGDEFFNLIKTAYSHINGYLKIKTPEDIFKQKDWNYWAGIDIHGSNDYDIILFGRKTNYGIKISGVGHDGERDSKSTYIAELDVKLHQLGYYTEISNRIADILIGVHDVPVVEDEDVVTEVLDKDIEWIGYIEGKNGYGWYYRNIGGVKSLKTMVGNPIEKRSHN